MPFWPSLVLHRWGVAWQRAEERGEWEQLQRRRGKALGELEKRSKREWSALYGRHQQQREHLAKDCRGVLGRFRLWRELGGGWTALAVLHAKLPRPGRANINRPDRILPSRLAMVDHTDRRARRRLFTPAAHAVERGGGQLKLPGFGLARTRITPALPLALYDLGGGSSMERGRGAPLALRLWVESILAVGLTDRANPWPTVLEIPLRELLAKLYPGKRRPKPNEYWPRIMQAVEILDSTRIPWEDPKTGKGGLQRIVNISSIPRGPGKLDDAVRIIVDLPPGTGKGPVVSPNLARYGVQSAPLYRGLLNLAYQWFDPGRTRRPVRGGKHWLQVEDPERYPTSAAARPITSRPNRSSSSHRTSSLWS